MTTVSQFLRDVFPLVKQQWFTAQYWEEWFIWAINAGLTYIYCYKAHRRNWQIRTEAIWADEQWRLYWTTARPIIDIDNFYYEVINNEFLVVNIDIFVDGEKIKGSIEAKNKGAAISQLRKQENFCDIAVYFEGEIIEITNCPACQGKVSSQAGACPHCGHPIHSNSLCGPNANCPIPQLPLCLENIQQCDCR